MKIFCIKHIEFENPSMIKDWAEEKGHTFKIINPYLNDLYPILNDLDMLVIMGGPMNIYEYDKYPWLKEEKRFIKNAIDNNKKVLGICLGAQLIADVMEAKVVKGSYKEIGWFEIEKLNNSYFFENFINTLKVFHWHGDTFYIPERTNHIFSSKACKNQAFEYEKRILALQFHIEMKLEDIERICVNCKNELNEKGDYIQSYDEIIKNKDYVNQNKIILYNILNKFEI